MENKDNQLIMNTEHYAVEVKETEQGIIIDIFHRHGELIDTHTYWNDDIIDKDESDNYCGCGGLLKTEADKECKVCGDCR